MATQSLAQSPQPEKQNKGLSLQSSLRNRAGWQPTKLNYAAMGFNAYLRFKAGDDTVTVYGNLYELVTQLKAALRYFEVNQGAHPERGAGTDWPTPEMVINKFRNSPNLRPMLADVEAVLRPMIAAERDRAGVDGGGQLAADVLAVLKVHDVGALIIDGKPVRGAQSRIAEVLAITTGGAHRKRILAVLRALQSDFTSTTEPKAA